MEKASVMNFLELLLYEALKNRNPMLDLYGSDRRVLQIACQDLMNFLKFHWKLVGKEASECELAERIQKFFNENSKELEEFLEMWTGVWFKKWKERVKLLIGKQSFERWNKTTKLLSDAEPKWRRIRNKQELQEVVVATLIKNGEICGTSIIAENVLKLELGAKNKKPSVNQNEFLLNTLNKALKKARELARTRGPLIFVKVDKTYFNISRFSNSG
jgi:hypothetical protein